MDAMEVGLPGDTIEVRVNGAALMLKRGSSVADLVAERSLVGKRIAVEIDGAIVPRSLHAVTIIAPGDQVEIVVAVGGG